MKNAIANNQPVGNDYYGVPFREEVVERFEEGGQTVAVISRNRYGALVLNTPNVLFADVDKPTEKPATQSFSLFKLLFGQSKEPEKAAPTFEERLVDSIREECERNTGMGLRLYRTTKGYRIALTTQTIPAREARAKRLLQGLGSDRLYINLCVAQDCYRARLTPKPWRCGSSRPLYGFPFNNLQEENFHREWVAGYDQARQGYATCALIGDFGSAERDPIADQIIQLHDHYVLDGDKPIA